MPCARFLRCCTASLTGLLLAEMRIHVWHGLLQACRRSPSVALVVQVCCRISLGRRLPGAGHTGRLCMWGQRHWSAE